MRRREVTPAQHEHLGESAADEPASEGAAVRVPIPGLRPEQDIGLGSLFARVTSAFGVKPCGGCDRRKEALDRRFAIRGRQSRLYRPPQ